ncbi:hypothetical protein JCM10207_001905 [Rhodosporidiobolus poonsookiae]
MSRPPAGTTARRSASSSAPAGGTTIQTTPSTSHSYHPSPLDAILAEQGLQRYHLCPPSWRPPWIPEASAAGAGSSNGGALPKLTLRPAGSSANGASKDYVAASQAEDVGTKAWPVFYPPRDGMEEDQMTEQVVKAGFASKGIVQAESFSAHQHIYDKLKTTDLLGNLSRLVSAVQAKAQSSLPSYGASTFRLPSRITLTDSKREAWFSDLANPSVPLSKLSRSVPHGYKGERGLDMLAHRKVDIPRAVWFVRAFGGVEIQSLAKSRSLPVAISLYTSEFTTVVSEFVRKQLAEVVLPSQPSASGGVSTPGAVTTPLAHPPTPSGTMNRARSASTSSNAAAAAARAAAAAAVGPGLMDEDKRKAWESKFEYTIRLVASLYEESLLDHPQFLRFLISLLESPASSASSLGQLPFALLLVEDYLSDLLASETATARLARGCLLRLHELDTAPRTALRHSLEHSLASLVRSAFLANPDAFVPLLPSPIYPLSSNPSNPSLDQRLREVLLAAGSDAGHDDEGAKDDLVLRETIEADFEELTLRRQLPTATLASFAQTSATDGASATTSAATDERALLAAIRRLDEIEFPVKMRDVHRAIFISPSALSPVSAAPSPSSNAMAATASISSSQPSSHSRVAYPAARTSANPSSSAPVAPLSLSAALPLFFTWATTPTRPAGQHRRYAVARLIALELERQSGGSSSAANGSSAAGSRTSARLSAKRTGGTGRSAGVEDAFVRWVDEQFPTLAAAPTTPAPAAHATPAAVNAGAGAIAKEEVRLLAEELVRAGVMSYGVYLQRMIARGETEGRGEAAEEEGEEREPSIHLWILRTIPLAVEGAAAGGARRRVALGGQQGIEKTLKVEDRLRVVREELARLVWAPAPASDADASLLLRTVRELADDGAQWSITRDIVPEGLSRRIDAVSGHLKLEVEQLAVAVEIYDVVQDWWGLLQLLLVLAQHSPPLPLLAHMLDVLEAHLDSWTALDGLAELGTVLASMYQASKAAGDGNSRRLLRFLGTFASGNLLSSKVVASFDADYRAAFASNRPGPSHSTSLPEVQSLLIDSSATAISQLVNALQGHHAASGPLIAAAIEGVVALLPQLPTAQPAIDFLRVLQDRLVVHIDDGFARWAAGCTVQQRSTLLGGSARHAFTDFVAGLVGDGLLSASTVVRHVVLPAWRTAASPQVQALAEAQQVHLAEVDSNVVETLHSLASCLVLPKPLGGSTISMHVDGDFDDERHAPSHLVTRQRQTSRRAALFTHANLPLLAQLLSFLVIQQEIATAALRVDIAESTGALFVHLSNQPALQALIARDAKGFRTAMLDGELVRSVPRVEWMRPKLLAGLLVTIKEGGEATPANLVSTEDWDIFLSGLTLWRLSISKVEVEACLERLDLDTTLSTTEKTDALHTLSQHFLARVCTGEGQSYLGEQVVKCYHGSASDELVSVAFSALATALTSVSHSAVEDEDVRTPAFTTLRCASRLLNTLLQSGHAFSRASSVNQLLEAIKACLSQDELCDGADNVTSERTQLILRISRLIVVALTCTPKPAEKATVELYQECLPPLVKLATSLARGRSQDFELSSLLLDTCSHVLYALPDLSALARPPSLHALLRLSSASSLADHPLSLDLVPNPTFSRLTRLFGPYLPSALVPNPWELLDHTDPSSATASLVRRSGPQLTNLGPIDLAAFRAKVVETIPAVTALDALSTVSSNSTASAAVSTPSFERGVQTNFDFETPCTTLTVAARDHRRTLAVTRAIATRLDAGNGAAAAQALAAQAANAQAAASRKRNAAGEAPKASPAASGSTAPTPTASTAAPGAKASAPAAAPAAGRGAKRKASAQADVVVLDSDEEEPAPPTKAKKARASTGGKTTASKTTASKAPAKRKK